MSGQTEVIREFLVSLGYDLKESDLKKFEGGVEKATAVVMKLGAETVALAGAITAAVTKIASNFEDLYYTSQRLNSTVENIRGVGFAISQMGGSARGGLGALEALANFIRSNPGGERFIENLGVSTRESNGELRDTSEILADLGRTFKGMPYYQAKVRANFLGIDEPTLQALLRGDISNEMDRYHQIAAKVGIDQQTGALKAHEFMTELRDLAAYLQLVGEKFLLILEGPARRLIAFFEDLDERTHGAATGIAGLVIVLGPLLMLVGPVALGIMVIVSAIGLLIDDFQTWKEGGKSLIDWARWSHEIDAVMAALKPLFAALGDLGGAIVTLAEKVWRYIGPALTDLARGGLRQVLDILHTLTDMVHVLTDLLSGQWAKAWTDAGAVARDILTGLVDNLKSTVKAVGDFWYGITHHGEAPPGSAPAVAPPAAAGGAGGSAPAGSHAAFIKSIMPFAQQAAASTGIAADLIVAQAGLESGWGAHAPGNNFFGMKGFGNDGSQFLWTNEFSGGKMQRVRQWFAKYKSASDSVSAWARLMSHNPRYANVAGAGDAAAQARALAADGYATAPDYAAQLQATIAAMKGPLVSQGAANDMGVSAAAGGGNVVHITQKTDIHVESSDPGAAGRAAAAEQDRVNGNLLRNTKGALR